MGTVDVFTKARSKAIEDNAITSGLVDANGNLILYKNNGSPVNAGNVKGPQGDASRYTIPSNIGGSVAYVRLATLDGINDINGANYNFEISGIGDYGTAARSTILIHASQRSADNISVKAWAWDLRPGVGLLTRKLGPYLYEIWLKMPPFQLGAYLTELASWHVTRNLDSYTTTESTDLVDVPIVSSVVNSSPTATYNPDGTITVKALDDASIKLGILEATYRGGPAKVKIDGILSSTPYGWLTRYDPFGSRQVRLIKTSTGWLISGQISDKDVYLPYSSSWRSYASGSGGWFNGAKATKLPSGIVVLKGMILSDTAPADGEVIVTLPEGMRPDNSTLVAVEQSEISRCVKIDADGTVRVYGTGWSANWLTLDGIAFPSAGTASWVIIGTNGSAYGSSFQRESNWATQFGEPAFWKDPYGFVWWRGLVQVKTALSVDNAVIVSLPAQYRAPVQEHIRGAGNGGYAGFGSQPASGLVWKLNSPAASGNWLSLGGLITKTADAYSLNPWTTKAMRFANSWAQHPSSDITRVSYLLREDGLRVLSGVMVSGTLGAVAWRFDEKEMLAEDGFMTIPAISNNSRTRITINPSWVDGDNDHGGLFLNAFGSNDWFSIDNRVYVP